MSVLRKKPFVEELLESLTTDEIVRLSSIINVKGEPEVVDLGLTGENPLPSSAPASIEDRIKLINLVLSPSSVYTGILIYHSTSYCALIGTVAYENDIIKLFKLDVASRKAEPINEKLTADELRRVIDDTMESKGAGGDKVQVGDILSDDEAAGLVITADGTGGAEWEKVANLLPGSDVESGSVASMLGFNDDGELVKGSVPSGSVVDAVLDGESENPVQNKAIVGGIAVVAHDIASDYDSTATYGVGDYALYENVLYKCKSANTTGSWDVTKWDEVTVGNELENVNEELEDYAKVDGNYPTMTVGSADNLTPFGENSGAEDTTPFVFQSAGGESDIGSQAYLRALRGNSVAWNQLLKLRTTTTTNADITGTYDSTTNSRSYTGTSSGNAWCNLVEGSYSVSIISGHKYCFLSNKTLPTGEGTPYFSVVGASHPKSSVIFTSNETNTENIYLIVPEGYEINITGLQVQLFDLTLMFGAGNEPTTVEEFTRMFPKPYYEYNAGELISSKVNGIKNVGYNAFDGELEGGNISNGLPSIGNEQFRTKNFSKVVPNKNYTFEFNRTDLGGNAYVNEYDENKNWIKENSGFNTNSKTILLSNNTHYVKLKWYKANSNWGSTNVPTQEQAKVCIHLTWDGSRTGFEPYETHTYPMPNVELRSAGSVYDEITPDGTLTRRVGVVDLGSLEWSKTSQNRFVISTYNDAKTGVNDQKANILCGKFTTATANAVYLNEKQNIIGFSSSNSIVVYVNDTYYANTDAIAFKTAMSGVYLFYELATPTETQNDAYKYQELTPIDDFGTQEFLYDNNIAIPVPQGNEFFYPVDYKAFIDSLGGREDVEYAASALVSQTQLTQALASFLSSIPGYDATKSQTLKNNQGSIQWEDNE